MNTINISEDKEIEDAIFFNVVADMTHYGVGLAFHSMRNGGDIDVYSTDAEIKDTQNKILIDIMESGDFYKRLKDVMQKHNEHFKPNLTGK